ncbi:putative transcription factor interactor and regulator C3H-WRC/GRF family [Helianthus annuus]|nr:putative transcription factor interactor and regulator C3H-WRC/GRF family [Helianthus annuus]
MADQKYCERHMNRDRHRSRKPVEGQPGHSVSNGDLPLPPPLMLPSSPLRLPPPPPVSAT